MAPLIWNPSQSKVGRHVCRRIAQAVLGDSEPFVFCRDKAKSFPDDSKAPVRATGATSLHAPFRIAFSFDEPPRISRLYAQLRASPRTRRPWPYWRPTAISFCFASPRRPLFDLRCRTSSFTVPRILPRSNCSHLVPRLAWIMPAATDDQLIVLLLLLPWRELPPPSLSCWRSDPWVFCAEAAEARSSRWQSCGFSSLPTKSTPTSAGSSHLAQDLR